MKDCTRLDDLGVFGFGSAEPVIYAALVTEDPLLLIGASGTGVTIGTGKTALVYGDGTNIQRATADA